MSFRFVMADLGVIYIDDLKNRSDRQRNKTWAVASGWAGAMGFAALE